MKRFITQFHALMLDAATTNYKYKYKYYLYMYMCKVIHVRLHLFTSYERAHLMVKDLAATEPEPGISISNVISDSDI